MTLVLDASVAVKLLVREHDTDQARRVLTVPDPLIGPDWALVDIANVLWAKVKRSELLIVHAGRHLEDVHEIYQQLYPTIDLIADALSLALRLRHPVYDCIYAALAIREGCRLVTADVGLVEAMRRGGQDAHVVLLSDFDA